MGTAFFISSCKEEISEGMDFTVTPVQVVYDMSVLQTDAGNASMRMSAPVMQRFEYAGDSIVHSYELYPDGFHVDAYTPDGQLETTIDALGARHVTTVGEESWCAFGDVVVTNHIKGERITSDTLYWNRAEQTIYTDCYVRLSSPGGMMQGYGLTSDERANNSTILRPFDAYGVIRDSTSAPYVDTVNMMGPML